MSEIKWKTLVGKRILFHTTDCIKIEQEDPLEGKILEVTGPVVDDDDEYVKIKLLNGDVIWKADYALELVAILSKKRKHIKKQIK